MAAPAERMEVRSYNAVNASDSTWLATDAYFYNGRKDASDIYSFLNDWCSYYLAQ